MKRVVALLVALLLVGTYATYALERPIAAIQPEHTFHYSRPAAHVSLAWPHYGRSALGATGYGVLETHGSSKPVPTASTIKVLTALMVLGKHPLGLHEQGPTIVLGQDDVDSYHKFASLNGSLVLVERGERLSEYQALQALLIPSANNMAESLARWTYGSLAAFNKAATAYAQTIDMSSTTVTDPSGFDPSTVSTPHDLVLLGIEALKNPIIAQIVQQTSAVLPVQGLVHNYNALLGQSGIVGIKTGNSNQDGGAYLFAATKNVQNHEVTIVGATMMGPDLSTTMHDSLPLIASAVKGFTLEHIAASNQTLGSYAAPWHKATGVTAKSVTLLSWSGSSTTTSLVMRPLKQATKVGTNVGTFTIHNSLPSQDTVAPVVLKTAFTPPPIWWRLTHP